MDDLRADAGQCLRAGQGQGGRRHPHPRRCSSRALNAGIDRCGATATAAIIDDLRRGRAGDPRSWASTSAGPTASWPSSRPTAADAGSPGDTPAVLGPHPAGHGDAPDRARRPGRGRRTGWRRPGPGWSPGTGRWRRPGSASPGCSTTPRGGSCSCPTCPPPGPAGAFRDAAGRPAGRADGADQRRPGLHPGREPHGRGRRLPTVVCLTLGTGVGGGRGHRRAAALRPLGPGRRGRPPGHRGRRARRAAAATGAASRRSRPGPPSAASGAGTPRRRCSRRPRPATSGPRPPSRRSSAAWPSGSPTWSPCCGPSGSWSAAGSPPPGTGCSARSGRPWPRPRRWSTRRPTRSCRPPWARPPAPSAPPCGPGEPRPRTGGARRVGSAWPPGGQGWVWTTSIT